MCEPLLSSGLPPTGARQPCQSGHPPNISTRGLGHWSSRPLQKTSPRECRGEAWAALRTRGLVQERLIHPHTPRRPLPSPIPATWPWPHTGLRATGWGAEDEAGSAPVGSRRDSPCSGRAMTRGPSGSGRRVLPATGGGEEGGESTGPAPPPSSTHDGGGDGGGGGGGTGGPGAGRHLRADRAPRPAPRSRPPRPLVRPARRREQGGRSQAAPERTGGGV